MQSSIDCVFIYLSSATCSLKSGSYRTNIDRHCHVDLSIEITKYLFQSMTKGKLEAMTQNFSLHSFIC